MPRKLRMVKERAALTLDSFSLMEIICFTTGWSPPGEGDQPGRWQTWDEYFQDFDAIRSEFVASEFARPGEAPFPDRVRELLRAHPDHVWQKHDHSALRHAHLYLYGDGHVHEGCFEAQLGPAIELVKDGAK